MLNLIYTIITTALIINESGTNFPDHSQQTYRVHKLELRAELVILAVNPFLTK